MRCQCGVSAHAGHYCYALGHAWVAATADGPSEQARARIRKVVGITMGILQGLGVLFLLEHVAGLALERAW